MAALDPLFVTLESVYTAVYNRSYTALWLVAAILVLRLVFRGAPKWTRGVLWALLAVRLILPFGIPSPFSVYNASDLSGDGAGSLEYLEYGNGSTKTLPEDWQPATGGWGPGAVDVWGPFGIHLGIYDLPLPLSAFWLMGTGLMLLYALASWLRLRHRVAPSLSLEEGVMVCDDIGTPFIFGVFQPKIYLPSYLPSFLAPSRLDCVLAHERAHLARRDHWWKPLGFLLLSVYWFDPVLWLCYALFCRDMELACDERAVRDMEPEARAGYAQALLDCSRMRPGVMPCPLAFSETGVKGRVKAVLRGKEPAEWLRVCVLCACGIAALCFLTAPWGKADERTYISEWLRGSEDMEAYVMDRCQIDGKRIVRAKPKTGGGGREGSQWSGHEVFAVYTQDGAGYELTLEGEWRWTQYWWNSAYWSGPELRVELVKWEPLA